MKKVLVMMLMMVLATFASPLFATNASPPSFENTFKINDGKLNADVNVNVGAAHADDVTFVKVDIRSLDSLIYSLDERDSNRAMKLSGYIQSADAVGCVVAVVCQPRGVIGV